AGIAEPGLDGPLAPKTPLARPGFCAGENEARGLSGLPLRARSTEIIRYISRATHGRLPIIGVGGIDCPEAAAEKLDAGAPAWYWWR
ncbi:MAG: dihydroorotate dehydrogenase (quinone), partial [Opitutaceae bacterium]